MLNVPKKKRHERGKAVLQEMGLKDFYKHYPYQVSGGMNQKVSIGRALIGDSKLLLLDEPFSSLDQGTTFKLINDFIELWQSKPITTLLVSHDIDVSILLSDKIILLTPLPAEIIKIIIISAEIIKIIIIPLLRPRNIDMLYSQDFLELRNEIIAIGRHEGAFLKWNQHIGGLLNGK